MFKYIFQLNSLHIALMVSEPYIQNYNICIRKKTSNKTVRTVCGVIGNSNFIVACFYNYTIIATVIMFYLCKSYLSIRFYVEWFLCTGRRTGSGKKAQEETW